MNHKESTNSKPFGYYQPSWLGRFLLMLIQLGLSRGKIKKAMQKIWRACGESAIVDIKKHGVNFRLNITDNISDSKLLFASKHYDRKELDALIKHNKGVFVDIGANTGYYSLYMAQHGGRILAIEPNPIAYERLRYNIMANQFESCITALPLGVGERGEQTLIFGDLGSGSTVLTDNKKQQVKINTLPLFEILESQEIEKIGTLKIDIEGAEDQALVPFFNSAPRESYPTCIVMEVVHRQYWQTDIIKHCLQLGYQPLGESRANIILILNHPHV